MGRHVRHLVRSTGIDTVAFGARPGRLTNGASKYSWREAARPCLDRLEDLDDALLIVPAVDPLKNLAILPAPHLGVRAHVHSSVS